MREILFRGRTIEGVWIQGYFFQVMNVENKVLHNMIMKDKTNIDVFDGKTFQASYIVEPETVGQYTGLKDKNGTKIFEGDIVKYLPDWRIYNDAEKYVVEWKDKSCGFEPFSDSMENCHHCGGGLDPADCEVIGNIHDNPELMEVADGK